MRLLHFVAAIVCLLPTCFAQAQTRLSASSLPPEYQSCITARPVPSLTPLPYYEPAATPQAVTPLLQNTVYQPASSQVVAPPTPIYQTVVPLRPAPPNYIIGRGIIGQPKLYVPGQPILNALRWLTL